MPIDTDLALVSLADAKEFLKITGSTEDEIVGKIVNHCSQWINKFCDRVLLEVTDRVEYHSGDGCSGAIMLNNFPVSEVDSVYVDATREFAAGTLVQASSYFVHDDTGVLELIGEDSYWLLGKKNIKVTYTAGYALADMPQDIQMACKLLIGYIYRTFYSQWRMGVSSETIGQKTVTFDKVAMPKEVEGMLKPYRKIKF